MTSVRTDIRRGVNAGIAIKVPVRCATTAAITLEGLQTIDGVTVVEGDRVLVKDQADATFNGIYDATTSRWQRSVDFDGFHDLRRGSLVYVTDGTTQALTLWRVSSANPSATAGPLPGTNPITFVQVALGGTGGGGGYDSSREEARTVSSSLGPYSLNAQFQSGVAADYLVMYTDPTDFTWRPALRDGMPVGATGLKTFTIGGAAGARTITFIGSPGWSDGGDIYVREFFAST